MSLSRLPQDILFTLFFGAAKFSLGALLAFTGTPKDSRGVSSLRKSYISTRSFIPSNTFVDLPYDILFSLLCAAAECSPESLFTLSNASKDLRAVYSLHQATLLRTALLGATGSNSYGFSITLARADHMLKIMRTDYHGGVRFGYERMKNTSSWRDAEKTPSEGESDFAVPSFEDRPVDLQMIILLKMFAEVEVRESSVEVLQTALRNHRSIHQFARFLQALCTIRENNCLVHRGILNPVGYNPTFSEFLDATYIYAACGGSPLQVLGITPSFDDPRIRKDNPLFLSILCRISRRTLSQLTSLRRSTLPDAQGTPQNNSVSTSEFYPYMQKLLSAGAWRVAMWLLGGDGGEFVDKWEAVIAEEEASAAAMDTHETMGDGETLETDATEESDGSDGEDDLESDDGEGEQDGTDEKDSFESEYNQWVDWSEKEGFEGFRRFLKWKDAGMPLQGFE